MCDCCLAMQGRSDVHPLMSYRNFGTSAAWPLTELSHEGYLVRDAASLSPWICMPGWRIETLAFDWMHICYLGCGRDLLGSGIRVLILEGIYDHIASRDIDAKLGAVHDEIQATCRQHGLYVPAKPVLSVANTGGDEFAEIGTRFKACHIKLMLWWLAKKSQESADAHPNNAVLNVLAACCWNLQVVTELMDEGGLILDEADASKAATALRQHVRAFAWLALHYHDQGALLFKIRPKMHYMMHMADGLERTRLNFNGFHVFDEESYLGKLKAIAQRVHGKNMSQRIFQRYFLTLAVFLHHHRKAEAI